VFRAEAKGRDLYLDNAGVVGGNEVFKDRETGSRWQQSSLKAISGPLQGERLELYPFLLTDWREWHRLHPDTVVLKPLPGYAERIPKMNEIVRQGLSGGGPTPPGMPPVDPRLKARTMVLGLDVGGSSEAFPLTVLRQARVINEEVGGQAIVIVHQPASDTTTAFLARANGKKLQFDAGNAETTEVTDKETGSRWDAYGKCISGLLAGSQLKVLILEPEYWFAWAEFHPGTKIYGVAEPKR
jgi:Protein of unknown function (DUF3179)